LPKEGLIPNSERIFRGPLTLRPIFVFGESDILLLNGRQFGVAGDYSEKGKTITKLVIPYSDSAAAIEAFHNLADNLDPRLKAITKSDTSLVFSDEEGKYGEVTVTDGNLSLIVNSPTKPSPPDRHK
jgi:hypothetical protein